ncbi:hypothetical protein UlMin_030745 [Ulmus minor]
MKTKNLYFFYSDDMCHRYSAPGKNCLREKWDNLVWNERGGPNDESFELLDMISSEPVPLFPKRTFQPSTIRRKWNHGFFIVYISKQKEKATKGGRRVIARRIAKGRSRIIA